MTAAEDRVALAVVGGGPAGMSAALLASQNGVDTLLLEGSDRLGGQVRWADAPIPDLLGCRADSGDALADRFARHLASTPARVRLSARVEAIRADDEAVRLTLAGGETVFARRALLATGLRHRRLQVPGEELADPAASPRHEMARWDGRRIAVVGGGDEACSLATDLAERTAESLLLVRRTPRARAAFLEPARRHPRVTFHEHTVVSRFERDGDGVRIHTAAEEELEVDHVFIRIGVEPALPEIEPELERGDGGRLRLDAVLRTSHPRLFAAGDLVRPVGQHYVAAALADGVVVARRVEEDLTATGTP